MKDNRDSICFPAAPGMSVVPGATVMPGSGMMGTPGMQPMPNPGMMGAPGMQPMPGMTGFPGGMGPDMNQYETRLTALERQIRRLETRVSRLESPMGAGTTPYQTSMQSTPYQPTTSDTYSYPYQTSMQMM